MKRKIVAALALAWVAVAAAEPIAYPGSTWGVVTFPSATTGAEKDNTVLQGKIEQGIDWFRFEDNWKFNTYVSAGYSVDNNGISYNNKFVPAVGAKVTREFSNGVADFGVQFINERRWKDDVNSSGVQAYASWWFGWNLKK